MLRELLCIIILLFISNGGRACLVEETDLLMTYIVSRHGDKTPVHSYSKPINGLGFGAFLQKIVFGEKANVTKQINSGYEVGKFIRKRYDTLLSADFDPSEIYVRSTFFPRTINSALYALSGIYSLKEDEWLKPMDWIPCPYNTVLPKYDYNTAFMNCPRYSTFMGTILSGNRELSPFLSLFEKLSGLLGFNITKNPMSLMGLYNLIVAQNTAFMNCPRYSTFMGTILSGNRELSPFLSLFEKLSGLLGFNITKNPMSLMGLYNLIVAQRGIGHNSILSEILSHLPLIKEVCDKIISIVFGDTRYLPLQSAASQVQAGQKVPKVYLHSAHDFNVYSMMAVTKVNTTGMPNYGASYSLELRRERSTQKYFVLPVFMNGPGEPEIYLTSEGCDGPLCEWEKFQSIISSHALDVSNWRNSCGWNEDIDVDSCADY
ncbi:prostatic acid phosphatase-like [Bombyx mandarina]|uniref:acid phosphatase n=1 Tax=Bombyx mandarina TaxID=7092 RepID=A0A6J2JA10_BOMMA|nr:prostatic acid phosphatase-like [Bombyx mandarina]